MRREGAGERLTIYVGESDQHGHTPLYIEIVQRARQAGLAGATVVRGIEGFGAAARLRTEHRFRLSSDAPVAVVVVDDPDRIDGFLDEVGPLIAEGLVVRHRVDVIRYGRR